MKFVVIKEYYITCRNAANLLALSAVGVKYYKFGTYLQLLLYYYNNLKLARATHII